MALSREHDPGAMIAELQRKIAMLETERNDHSAERDAALAREAALAEVLAVINGAGGDPGPVYRVILEKAHTVCGAEMGDLGHFDGTHFHSLARHNMGEVFEEIVGQPFLPTVRQRRLLDGERYVHIHDTQEAAQHPEDVVGHSIVDLAGARTYLMVPLVKDGELCGYISAHRQVVRPFTDQDISLLESFAAQAVIAMESARLLDELQRRRTEAEEQVNQQNATIDVLRRMAVDPANAQPVFDLIARYALELCQGGTASVVEYDGERLHMRAYTGTWQNSEQAAAYVGEYPMRPDPTRTLGICVVERRIVHIHDSATETGLSAVARRTGVRSAIGVPMMREGRVLGAVSVSSERPNAFSDRQVALLESFADQAVIALSSAAAFHDLGARTAEVEEALERQTAMAEVLAAINANPADPQPVFEVILEKAHRLCGAEIGSLGVFDGTYFRKLARHGYSEAAAAYLSQPYKAASQHAPLLRGETLHIPDTLAHPWTEEQRERALPWFIEAELRSWLEVPMFRDGRLLGTISGFRREARAFSAQEISLLESFAAQALIAMENARLITEQREALERQKATSDVLETINASVGELQPVFETMLDRAMHLCGAAFGEMHTYNGTHFQTVAQQGVPEAFTEYRRQHALGSGQGSVSQRMLDGEDVIHIPDMMAEQVYQRGDPSRRAVVDLGGARSAIAVAMRTEGRLLGLINIYRQTVGPYDDRQIAVLRNFAAQAVIAMENARLLTEQREALERQTALAEVMQSINSSPGKLDPVFEVMVDRTIRLCDATAGTLFVVHGDTVPLRSHRNLPDAFVDYLAREPPSLEAGSLLARSIHECTPINVADLIEAPSYRDRVPLAVAAVELGLIRSICWVPLVHAGRALGLFAISRREVRPFTARQMALLEDFAGQATIAMVNARLLEELRQQTETLARRNSEFGERIEQQAATIDVLRVMSSSPGNPQPVFDQIVRRARLFCGGTMASLGMLQDGMLHLKADDGHEEPHRTEYRSHYPMQLDDTTMFGRAILARDTMILEDSRTDPRYAFHRILGDTVFSTMTVPIMRGEMAVGALHIGRANQIGKFSTAQIDLLRTFAEQAVIAITSAENYRALQERTAELSRSVSELQALEETIRSVNSSLDLETVLATIIDRAVQLSESDEGTIYEFDEGEQVFVPKAAFGMSAERIEALRQRRVRLGETHLGRAALRRGPVHVSDVQVDPNIATEVTGILEGIHAVLAVPLLREDKVIGGLVIRRRTVGDFAPTIPTLLQTFAGQSVLAIENARLFQQLADRQEETRRAREAAEAALENLRRAQDRLVQSEKMASLGQLTAGVAHEIKNPLNFVNNFSDLSADLLDELNEVLAPLEQGADAKLRAEIDELTATLKSNLAKIAEHGRRADSIVKNMLEHSRTGASERRAVDLNALAEEALNLAYHGARAEIPGFNITMERDFDPSVSVVELYPQEFTRVLVNLINNGFYATRKRAEREEAGFQPSLRLSTHALDGQVEVRVRDNGTGIPAEVREKIFEPFFTTKPAGEGTGLGLSLSYDIVVKQHGGQLAVESEPGSFTEFTITLPRPSAGTADGEGKRA